MKPWTEEEVKYLRKNSHRSYRDIAFALERSHASVYNKKQALGLPSRNAGTGARPGERHHRAKLTEALVREMRAKYAAGGRSHFSIWEEYYPITGVEAISTVADVLRRKTWRHVA